MRQKAKVKWLEDEDANTAFFHNIIKDRRRKLSIHKIKDMEGNWVEGSDNVANAGVHIFQKLFSAVEILEDSQILSIVQKVVTDADNILLTSLPTILHTRS